MNLIRKIITLIALLLGCALGVSAEDFNENLIKGLQAYSEHNYTESLRYYKQGAAEGDKYCCGRLAAMYLNGIGTDSNFTEARKWATTGYQLGNSYAAAVLGYTYFFEYGMDNPEAFRFALPYLEFAYNAEDREFENADLYANIGLLIATTKMQTGEMQDGLKWLDTAIEDFPTFSPILGQAAMCYWSLENYSKAARYATMADKENNLQGTFVLGWCMAHGEGIDLNAEDGFKKIRKAANVGTPDYAVFALGECYYNGIGTAVNKQLAKEWFQKAADAGIEDAQEKLDILF